MVDTQESGGCTRDKTARLRARHMCVRALCRSRACAACTCCAALRCATRRSASRVPHSIHSFIHSIPFHSIPFHSIPFHSIPFPFHSIPFHSIPFHSIPFHSIPFHSIPFHSIHSIPFHSIPFHSIPFHFISFHFISFHSFIHMPTQGHNVRQHTHDERHTTCSGVRGGAGVCVECDCLFFRARGIEAREVASSGAHRPHSTLAVHACAYHPREGGRWKEEVSAKVACAVLCMCACTGCTVLCTICCVTRSHADTRPQCLRQHTHDERHTTCSGVRGGAGVCVCVECDCLFFRARGIEAREVASSGAQRPHPSLREPLRET